MDFVAFDVQTIFVARRPAERMESICMKGL